MLLLSSQDWDPTRGKFGNSANHAQNNKIWGVGSRGVSLYGVPIIGKIYWGLYWALFMEVPIWVSCDIAGHVHKRRNPLGTGNVEFACALANVTPSLHFNT